MDIPKVLGETSFEGLLHSNKIRIDIDEEFPVANGVVAMIPMAMRFGNFRWEVLNSAQSSPFLISDYPVGIEETDDPRVVNRLLPLSPSLAIRILPDIRMSGDPVPEDLSRFSHVRRKVSGREVRRINTALVRGAEKIIMHDKALPWVASFVEKHRHYRVESVDMRIPKGRGFLIVASERVRPYQQS